MYGTILRRGLMQLVLNLLPSVPIEVCSSVDGLMSQTVECCELLAGEEFVGVMRKWSFTCCGKSAVLEL